MASKHTMAANPRAGIGRLRAATLTVALALCGCPAVDEDPARAPEHAPGGAPPTAQADGSAAVPRVILVISIDTLRADHLGTYGYERFTSPILDAFAAQGVVFEDASSPAPWTLPAHASLLTGRFPASHGVTTVRTGLPAQVPTLASLLARAGYVTAAVVNSTWLKPEEFGLTREFTRHVFVPDDPSRRSPNRAVTDQAMEWLRETRSRRLFVFAHYYDVHSDYASEPAYERLFVGPYDGIADGTAWQLTLANLEDDYLEMCHQRFDPAKCTFAAAGGQNLIDEKVERLRFDEADVRHLVDLYDAGIRQFDTELGRLLGFLDEQGLSDETLVVVTSDHGEEFMEHGRVDHFLTTYQEVLRVPLILRGPGVPAGLRVAAPVSLVDVVPTVLGLAGAAAPAGLDGVDLSRLWREGDPLALDERLVFGEASGGLTFELVVGENYFPIYSSVRQGRFKLVHDTKSDRDALYDLAADPREQRDVAAAHPELAARLGGILRARRDCEGCGEQPGVPVALPPEDAERLRALGYVP